MQKKDEKDEKDKKDLKAAHVLCHIRVWRGNIFKYL